MLGKTLILFFSLSKNIYSIYLEKHRSLNFDRLKKKKNAHLLLRSNRNFHFELVMDRFMRV